VIDTKQYKQPNTYTMKTILTSLILLTLIACNQPITNKVERENEPDVYGVEESDAAMNYAIDQANKTFKQFVNTIQNDKNGYNYYSIKQRFPTPEGLGEHIWVGQITYVDNQFIGIVGNEPINTTAVKLGDTITVDQKNISDWMIVDQNTGKAKGGFTIRAIRNRMTPKEQQELDQELGLIFE